MEAGLTTGRKRIAVCCSWLFVTDLRANTVRVFDRLGLPLASWTSSFRGPCGCGFRVLPDGTTECYVADEGNHAVKVFALGRRTEWSPDAHVRFPPAERARAIELIRLGHLLSLTLPDEKQVALRDVWRALVLPFDIEPRLTPRL